MYGTEKQIKWAEDIILKAYDHVDSIIAAYTERRDTEGERRYEMNNDIVLGADKVREWINNCVNDVDDAYKWIKARDMFSVPKLNNMINKYARSHCNYRKGMECLQLDLYYKVNAKEE